MATCVVVPCRNDHAFLVDDHPRKTLSAAEAVYRAAWVSLLADSPLGLKPRRVVAKFAQLLEEDFRGTALRLNAMAIDVMRSWSFEDDVPHCQSAWYGPRTLPEQRSPIMMEITSFLETPRSDVATYVLTFLTFGKKCQYDDTTELEEKAITAWYGIETAMATRALPDWVADLRLIVGELLASFRHIPLPAHGRGRVANREVETIMDKHRSLSFSWEFFRQFARYDDRVIMSIIPDSAVDPFSGSTDTMSRLTFVEKDMGAVRSICMESAVLQWAQQSVRHSLELTIQRSAGYRFIRIDDQTYNQIAARAGSALSHLVTLDLSSASDSVSYALMLSVFTGRLRALLDLTRSDVVELPNGRPWVLEKFAPMGSAVCFPVQSIIYLSIILRAYCVAAYGSVTTQNLRRVLALINDDPWDSIEGFGSVRVYGDDLIFDSHVTDLVVESLTTLGFKVNTKKSFTGNSAYRESCGKHYIFGNDCTPFVLKLKDVEANMTPGFLAGLVEAGNRALEYGYTNLRNYLVSCAHWYPWKGPLPRPLYYDSKLGIDGDPVIDLFPKIKYYKGRPCRACELRQWGVHTREVCSCDTREKYQRDEGRFLVVDSDDEEESRDERYSYVQSMRSPYGGDVPRPAPLYKGDDHWDVLTPVRYKPKFGWRWLPISI